MTLETAKPSKEYLPITILKRRLLTASKRNMFAQLLNEGLGHATSNFSKHTDEGHVKKLIVLS